MRTYLKKGTIIQLDSLDYYMVQTEQPIGEGGGGILYSAARLCYDIDSDSFTPANGIDYALKECFPVSQTYHYIRKENGEIVPDTNTKDCLEYLEISKEMQLSEKDISSQIYKKGFRITPVLFGSRHCRISCDQGKTFSETDNVFTVMESLHEKGASLKSALTGRKTVSCFQALSIIQQILHALKEVHDAGYLYLDIQAGNIFVKGNLDWNSEYITLIDFGSARKLLEDGKTAPVENRVLFSTEGFTAPEMLLHNDGTLRLDYSADLYSVGYLLLILLTGKKYTSKEIINTRNGNYIKRLRQPRLNCPKHLLPLLKEVLARTLCVDPSGRYSSADEMLLDVEQLVTALRPSISSLYSIKYDAFICYRHGETDSQAASTLQQELEHLHVPKGATQRARRKPIQRVFVDEGELSSCADFGMQINEALKNSDYLIVICSPDTPNSPWVNKEIETFLEFHDRSHILAVLTGGEPEESFPELLKKGKDHDEVFAADARGTSTAECLKKIKKDALLRIAAPILGTTYDGLKQRRQAYVLRQAAVVSSFVFLFLTGFLSFSLWQNAQIQKNYNETRKKQAKILSADAIESYQKGNLIDALQQVLSVLPDENSEEALVPEQIYALNKVTGANNDCTFQLQLYRELPEESFSMGMVSSDKLLYAGINQRDEAVLINPLTGDIINRINVSDIPGTLSASWNYVYPVDENTVILFGTNDIIGMHLDTMEVFSQLSNSDKSFYNTDFSPAISSTFDLKTAVFDTTGENIVIFNLSQNVVEDYIEIRTINVSEAVLDFSKTGDTLYIGARDNYKNEGGLYCYSLVSHQMTRLSSNPVVFLKCTDRSQIITISFIQNEEVKRSEDYLYNTPLLSYSACIYDEQTTDCIYEKSLGTHSHITFGGFESEIVSDNSDQPFHAFIFWADSFMVIYDLDHRAVYNEYSFERNIVDADLKESFLTVTHQDGSSRIISLLNPETVPMFTFFNFDVAIKKVTLLKGGLHLLQTSDKLLWLSRSTDQAIQKLDNSPDSTVSYIDYLSDGDQNYRVVGFKKNRVFDEFTVYETGSASSVFHYQLTSEEQNLSMTIDHMSLHRNQEHTLLSFYLMQDSSLATEDGIIHCVYYQVDLNTGEFIQTVDFSSFTKYLRLTTDECYDYEHERLFFSRPNGGVVYLNFVENQVIPSENIILDEKNVRNIYISGDSNYLIMICEEESHNSEYSIWIYDLQTQEVYDSGYALDNSSIVYRSKIVCGNSSSIIAIYDGKYSISFYDCQKQQELSSIQPKNYSPYLSSGGFMDKDQIFVTTCNDNIVLYSCDTGEVITSEKPDKNISDSVYNPSVQLITSSDSDYFALRSSGTYQYTHDGLLIAYNPLYVYQYCADEKAIYRICDIPFGIIDLNSLEVLLLSDGQIRSYSKLYSFRELKEMAEQLLSLSTQTN